MTTTHFYQLSDRFKSPIQKFPSEQDKGSEKARLLSIETVHRAIKFQMHLEQETFEDRFYA